MAFLKVLAAILALCVIAAIAFTGGYHWVYPTYVVRYRLTITALVGQQQHSGSSVVEVRVATQPRLLDSPRWHFRVDGEAAYVDLGGSNLVALLAPGPRRGSDAINVVFKAFRIPFLVENAADLKTLRGERPVEPGDWPAFVTFRDVTNPMSVEPVNPPFLEDGTGARIVGVTLTITQDPVTHTLEKNLPWLASSLSDQDTVKLSKRQIARRSFIRNDP